MEPEVELAPCPGLYCGWSYDETGNLTGCGVRYFNICKILIELFVPSLLLFLFWRLLVSCHAVSVKILGKKKKKKVKSFM